MSESSHTTGDHGRARSEASLVSIVVPCYEQAQYLVECVASVMRQTYQAWELIIVDDGSPDDCSEVATRLMADNPGREIHLVRQENSGVARARNNGIANARGDYILPLDADDVLAPLFLERTVAALDAQTEMQFAYTDHQHFGASDIVIRCIDYVPRAVMAHNRFAYCTLYRRLVWEKVGGYNTNMIAGYEDWDFWVSAVQHGLLGVHIPEVLFFYRAKEGSRDAKARVHDAELKAQIIVNHPGLYSPSMLAYAEKILSQASRGVSTERLSPLQRFKLDLWLAYHGRDPMLISRVIRDGLLEATRRLLRETVSGT
jgi:glycosyltransferase involved in cell wall biosynthesis